MSIRLTKTAIVALLAFPLGQLCCAPFHSTAAAAEDSFPVTIHVDAGKTVGEMRPIWRFFGADEPNYAYMKDGQKLLGELGELRHDDVFFRTHNLLTSGDGTPALKWGSTGAYKTSPEGQPVYDWTILDRIFSTYLERGVRPYVQIGFMPRDLSTHPEPYQHEWKPGLAYQKIFTGWAYPPKDYDQWSELAYQWANHCVERFGRPEVERWYWEVWNEPNIGYWQGTPEEFQKLHDYAIAGVRRALPNAKVGGPDVAGDGGKFLVDFLEHELHAKNFATGEPGKPLDFVSFHAKGKPESVDGHVRLGIADQLRTIDRGFHTIASFPELKNTPIVIGESDPDGCAACQGAQLGYRNTTMYSSYTAASIAREFELADRHGVHLEGALTWAFEFEDQPYFAGFRVLASNGIDLPVLNVFRMLAKMSGNRVAAVSDSAVALDDIVKHGVRDKPDVSALASSDGKSMQILLWHYHDDDVPGPAADVTLSIDGLAPGKDGVTIQCFAIDDEHSNAFTAWKQMGEPSQPTAEQYATLEQRGKLAEIDPPKLETTGDNSMQLHLSLPRRGVTLLSIAPK